MRQAIISTGLFAGIILILSAGFVQAGNPYEKYYKSYPQDKYIVGIGEAPNTGSKFTARRMAEVLARRDIATQINVQTTEVTVDLMCSGSESTQCRDEVVSIIETSANEFLRGSKVVDSGESGDTLFVIVVMPKDGALKTLDVRIEGAVSMAKEDLSSARSGDKEALERARKQYTRARTYEIERQMLEGVKVNASKAFVELEKELEKLR